ncbi:MAG: hypothetical protein M3321_09990 [Actinomycetota bacterium]|nr:hypothetical protein [Actinomycetota bacterium]
MVGPRPDGAVWRSSASTGRVGRSRGARGGTNVVLHVLDGRMAELEIYAGHGRTPRVDVGRLEHVDWSA